MLLKNTPTLIAISLIFCFAAPSHGRTNPIVNLKAGVYKLVSGPKHLCPHFTISEHAATEKTVTLGSLYLFETANSNNNVESDLDPSCEFKETNKRIDSGNGETKLVRTNQEICKKELISSTRSTAVIRENTIEIQHEILGVEPYTCIWNISR